VRYWAAHEASVDGGVGGFVRVACATVNDHVVRICLGADVSIEARIGFDPTLLRAVVEALR
jgi:hypothetical protein